jgi:hypothetical protein
VAFDPELLVLAAHGVDVVLIAGIVASALRAYRLSHDARLRLFAVGFALLGASHIAVAGLDAFAYAAAGRFGEGSFDHFDSLFWAYYAAALLGLAAIFASFGRHPFRWTPVLTPVLLLAGPLLESLVLLELFFVVLHAGLNHIARARAGSLRTALGFFALLVGHFLFFLDYAPLTPRAPLGEVPTTVGYVLLWFAVARPRGGA